MLHAFGNAACHPREHGGGIRKQKRKQRGYDTNHLPRWVQDRLKAFENTCVACNVTEAVLTYLSIFATAWLAVVGFDWVLDRALPALPTLAALAGVYIVALTVIARQQRGMELMVHDASHGVWYGADRAVNDRLANLLVAYPVLSSVKSYWNSHRIHHGKYGSHTDPCKRRFENIGLADIDLSTRWKIARAVLRWAPRYNREYYREIGSASLATWRNFALWHLTVSILPVFLLAHFAWGMGIVQALATAMLCWIAFWMFPAVTSLPVLRSIAEAEEHDYEHGETEFETTFTNASCMHRLLFHPKNDAYHLIHHLFPNIPERVHHKVHALLMAQDPRYRGALHRSHVLQPADHECPAAFRGQAQTSS